MTVNIVDCAKMKEWMEQNEPMLLLDIRMPHQVMEWRIPAEPGGLINIPFPQFEEQQAAAGEGLPRDKKVVIVCNRGRTAKITAEILQGSGLDLYVLEGGMNAWSQFYKPVAVHADDTFKLFQLIRLGKGCLSYMIVSRGEAAVVDPGRHVGEYVKLAEQEGAQITRILDTHLHADHISGASELAALTGATYYLSAQEVQDGNLAYEDVTQHQRIELGGIDLQVMMLPTPGHTPGSVSFFVNQRYLLTGDTVFVSGLGRPDLGGKAKEWAMKLHDTVFRTIAPLPDDVIVLPAHFSDSSEIGAEGYAGASLGAIRADNDVLRMTEPEAFAEHVASRVGATPPNYESIVRINRGLDFADDDKRLELEIGPNRCAVKHMS